MENVTPQQWQQIFDVNVTGVFTWRKPWCRA